MAKLSPVAFRLSPFNLDNLTHTLIGILVGESAARLTAVRSAKLAAATRRNMFVTIMAFGSNLPDLDFLPSRFLDDKLHYLLHHRGHTHTILGAVTIAALLYLASEAWCRWHRHALSATDRVQLAAVACLATLLHIALDFTNTYGVHPFWPFDNRWYYGDAVFIVEPLLWAVCAPLVFFVRTSAAKVGIGLALAAGVLLSFTTGLVPLGASLTLLLFTLAMLAAGKLMPQPHALALSAALWLTITGVFAASSATARDRSLAISSQTFPQDELLDIVLTPLPVNPLCWQVQFVHADTEAWYVRQAALSIAPRLIPADRCPLRGQNADRTVPYAPIAATNTAAIAWSGEIRTSHALLADALPRSCPASAFMRFARAPWLTRHEDKWILGDARYDHERALGFAEIEIQLEEACAASWEVPWVAPRRDLLEFADALATHRKSSPALAGEDD
jgi:inner membrane protein